MTKCDDEHMEECIEKQSNKETGKWSDKDTDDKVAKDADCPKSRMQQLQEEFHMSDLEVEGITEFVTSLKDNNILGVMEEMIKCETLNTRQKAAFAHALGIFRTEESMSFRIRSSAD